MSKKLDSHRILAESLKPTKEKNIKGNIIKFSKFSQLPLEPNVNLAYIRFQSLSFKEKEQLTMFNMG